jgi:hypothetical protein
MPPPIAPRPRQSKKILFALLGAASLGLLILIGSAVAVAASHDTGRDDQEQTTESAPREDPEPTLPMFDPSANQREVLESIDRDYCTAGSNALDRSQYARPNGSLWISCHRTGGDTPIWFQVWPDPRSFEIALNAGIDCVWDVVVYGPSWMAEMLDSGNAQPLLDAGGDQGTCD